MVYLLALLVFLFCTGSSRAEMVDIHQVVAAAISERPLVKEAEEQVVAARAAVGEARSGLLPRVTLQENFYATDEPAGSLFISLNQEDLDLESSADAYNYPPTRKDFETRLSLEQALFDPEVSYAVKRAKKNASATAAEAKRSKEGAAFSAFQAYLRVQQAQAAFAWISSSQREGGEILRVATERRDAGVGLKADVLRAQVMVAHTDQLSISAEHELILARRQLALAMGRPGDEVDIAGPLAATTLAVLAEDRPLARADLEALALEMEAAELGYRQSRAAYLPRLGLNVSYAFHDGSTPFGSEASAWSVQAGLNWELFDGLLRSNRLARTDAGKRAARARFEERTRQVDYLLGQARLQVEETRQHLTVAERALVAAEEGQRLVLQRYTAGLDDLSALLATQAALDRARLDLVQATSRHLLALGNVAFQNGTFLQTMALAQENKP